MGWCDEIARVFKSEGRAGPGVGSAAGCPWA